MITTEFKLKVTEALKEARKVFGGSDAKFAISIDINPAQWSRIKNGDVEKVLSDAKWITFARVYNVQLKDKKKWNVANTPVFQAITAQLEICQNDSISCIICDIADIGKTFTAKVYAQKNKNAIYVDCSQAKTKQKLIRQIAKQYGVGHTGKYAEVYADLVFYLNIIDRPITILDEVGDVNYDAFLELKALWNATELSCAWVLMGADGLKEKMDRNIAHKKVGYTEIFSRFGGKYQSYVPLGTDEKRRFEQLQAALIIKANAPGEDTQKIIARTNGSLRRIYTELSKISA